MRRYLIVATVIVMIVGAGIAVAGEDDTTVIDGCAKSNNGQLRIADGPDDCNKSEYPVSWNSEGQPGPTGPQGIQGEKGEPGDSGGMPDYYAVTDGAWLEPGDWDNANAVCDEGDQVVNGGYWVASDDVEIRASYPVAEKDSPWDAWRVTGQNFGIVGTNFQATALCADLTP